MLTGPATGRMGKSSFQFLGSQFLRPDKKELLEREILHPAHEGQEGYVVNKIHWPDQEAFRWELGKGAKNTQQENVLLI